MKAKKGISFLLVCCMLFALVSVQVFADTEEIEAEPTVISGSISNFTVVNPYDSVDWDTYGQYRAALHMHTTRSDGTASVGETILDLYNKGFDVIAITDHDVNHSGEWADDGLGALTESQRDAIRSGAFGRTAYVDFDFPGDFGSEFRRPEEQGGMIAIPFTNEQSRSEHIITLWADFNNEAGWTQEQILQETAEQGGVAILAHPGRYTTGAAGGEGGITSSNNPVRISRYVELFDMFDIALGFELFNRLDNETRSDRILWDNILQVMMPYGRFVWGFSNDDSHSMNQAGYNFNVLLMPGLNSCNAREAMESGAFYMVTRVNRGVAPTDPTINTILPNGNAVPNGGTADTLFMLEQTTPSIVNIEVNGNTITIAGADYDRIEWIADGVIIYTGATLDLVANQDSITTNHVRAQLVSNYGMALTQPFGILPEGESFQERPVTNNLTSIDLPLPINVPHGAEISGTGLRLPVSVTAVTERNWRATVEIEWDLTDLNYDPTETEEIQVFDVTGTITLPDSITNAFDTPLTVTVEVTAGVDPTISIAEANALTSGIVTVEGFVTARRPGDNHRIVIQDSTDPWGGIFVQDASVSSPDESVAYQYAGSWVRITGNRGVQWGQPAIHALSIELLDDDTREPIEAITLSMEEFTEREPYQWNSMLIMIESPILERDAGPNNHVLAQPEGQDPLVRLLVDLPDHFQNGDYIFVNPAIVHWHASELSHRFHADWVYGEVSVPIYS